MDLDFYMNGYSTSWMEQWSGVKFLYFQQCMQREKKKKVSHLIWLTTAWCIWMERNDVLFEGKVANALEVVDRIKRLLWSWFICGERQIKILFSQIGGWTLLYVFKTCNFLTYCNGFRVPLGLVLIKSCL